METYIKIKVTREEHDVRDVVTNTIGELIENLKQFPSDAKIVISFDNGYMYGGIGWHTLRESEVETYAEEAERIRKEEDEEERTHWVCPKCGGVDTPVCSVRGGYQCMECGERFNKPIIKTDNE